MMERFFKRPILTPLSLNLDKNKSISIRRSKCADARAQNETTPTLSSFKNCRAANIRYHKSRSIGAIYCTRLFFHRTPCNNSEPTRRERDIINCTRLICRFVPQPFHDNEYSYTCYSIPASGIWGTYTRYEPARKPSSPIIYISPSAYSAPTIPAPLIRSSRRRRYNISV